MNERKYVLLKGQLITYIPQDTAYWHTAYSTQNHSRNDQKHKYPL